MDKYVIKYLEEEVEVLKPIPIKGFFYKNDPQWQIKSLKGRNDCLINDELDTNDIWVLSSKNNCPITWNNTLIIMFKLV